MTSESCGKGLAPRPAGSEGQTRALLQKEAVCVRLWALFDITYICIHSYTRTERERHDYEYIYTYVDVYM